MLRGCRIEGARVTVGCPPPSLSLSENGEEWKAFQFHFHNFAQLSTKKGHHVASPEFTCNGHQWEFRVYPGGDNNAAEGQISVYIRQVSRKLFAARFGVKVIDKLGKAKVSVTSLEHYNYLIKSDWISRSLILDESQNILDSNGTLTVVVSIEEEPTAVFIPKNPIFKLMKEMFNDETTADVCFEVSSIDEKETGEQKSMPSVSFHAHRWILEKCAPMLAAMCESNNDGGGVVTASVNDVKPDIFSHLLSYVYGDSIPEEELEAHAKDIIDAANKYFIVNLKLEAEAVFLNTTKFTIDNAMDNLLYADAKNCALLKETVLDFLVENSTEAINKISFADFPGNVVKDLMVAFDRSRKHISNQDYSMMRVSELRRKLNAKGLDVDGSREAMIDALNNSDELNETSAEE